eukprot:2911747-Rhodomonas_salina.1
MEAVLPVMEAVLLFMEVLRFMELMPPVDGGLIPRVGAMLSFAPSLASSPSTPGGARGREGGREGG